VRFLTGVCGADVWPNHSEINRQVQKWTMTRVAVDAATSIRLLQEKLWLPARSPIPGRDGDDTGHAKATMRACRYLNQRVSHFFQRIGDRVSAAYIYIYIYIYIHYEASPSRVARLPATRRARSHLFACKHIWPSLRRKCEST